jgi:hypothetical protein
MSDLDGLWNVKPFPGVRKRIAGGRGETIVAGLVRIPFDVRDHELRYRRPLAFLVDRLERDGAGFRGRATAFGRTYARFELRKAVR